MSKTRPALIDRDEYLARLVDRIAAQDDEIERLRAFLGGVEIALNRDDDIAGARRLLESWRQP
jgi:hypothetical protein